MRTKRRTIWNFDPDHITWPYALLIPGVLVISALIGIIAGDFVRWGGLVLCTAVIFAFFINASRRFFHERRFWLLTALVLGTHVAVFVAILLHIQQWKLIWLNVMLLELPPFLWLRTVLLGKTTGE
jgi:hypothetical protein